MRTPAQATAIARGIEQYAARRIADNAGPIMAALATAEQAAGDASDPEIKVTLALTLTGGLLPSVCGDVTIKHATSLKDPGEPVNLDPGAVVADA